MAIPKRKSLHAFKAVCLLIGIYGAFLIFIKVSGIADYESNQPSKPANEKLIQNEVEVEDDHIEEIVNLDEWNFDTSLKKDWHDWEAIEADKSRTGPGENGVAVDLTDLKKDPNYETLYRANGFSGFTSDNISPDRSVNDIRHPGCSSQKYSSDLPTVSIVIPFIDEHWSVLKRTIHSVVKRSPRELLREVILVDDFSSKRECISSLNNYLEENAEMAAVVKVKHLPKRSGLITARQTGAKEAKGQVLVFLDSHIEANYNWLPPLLDPIANDYRTVVCPFIDVIDMNDFEYRAQDEGKRGAFDWELYYKRLDLLPESLEKPTEPFESPVMAGGLFAISAKWFNELEGYDEGLKIWGGEQYELSFKIWQCGGKMYDAPCSRVGHIYRSFPPYGSGGFGNYLDRNYKRVAAVWMDEYADYIYMRKPNMRNLDPGDISKQKALRNRLDCKPFRWFMENVAWDLSSKYPPVEPPDISDGKLESMAKPGLCVNTQADALRKCSDMNGGFKYTYRHEIRPQLGRKGQCWDVAQGGNRAPVEWYQCHLAKGNQEWDVLAQGQKPGKIQHSSRRCLTVDENLKIFVSSCDKDSLNQMWKFL